MINSLKDPVEAKGYLNAAIEGEDINVFLLALQNVIQAQGGIAALAAKTKKSRTSLYKSLSENSNPYLKKANDLFFLSIILPKHYLLIKIFIIIIIR